MSSVEHGRGNNKGILYLVKWLDYPERKDWTEKPFDNFSVGGLEKLREFHRQNPDAPRDYRLTNAKAVMNLAQQAPWHRRRCHAHPCRPVARPRFRCRSRGHHPCLGASTNLCHIAPVAISPVTNLTRQAPKRRGRGRRHPCHPVAWPHHGRRSHDHPPRLGASPDHIALAAILPDRWPVQISLLCFF